MVSWVINCVSSKRKQTDTSSVEDKFPFPHFLTSAVENAYNLFPFRTVFFKACHYSEKTAHQR